jgi:peptidoglycan pentaglycine glycine transferase (the first glycine)
VRRAARGGVVVQVTPDAGRIRDFVNLCVSISVRKGFELRVTPEMIYTLLSLSSNSENVKAAQFVSLKDRKLGSGLFVIRVGRSLHQIWGGLDRDFRQDHAGEACQWAVIEWALAQGCTRYDLEGIDPINNPSVYQFKRRLGGEEVTLHGLKHFPLSCIGRLASIGHKAVAWQRR